MRILVIDVAAEYGGAVTILDQFIEQFQADHANEYYIVLSKLKREDKSNINYINFEWVKNSKFHRVWFDKVYCKKLARDLKPDKILSLQNSAVSVQGIEQDVYFQNALPISDYKISFSQSKTIWLYQKVIGNDWKRSLKHASHIYVQAEWVKKTIAKKWNVSEDIIIVLKPKVDMGVVSDIAKHTTCNKGIFYPANGSVYKNHLTLIKALISVWKQTDDNEPHLYLTGKLSDLPLDCQAMIKSKKFPIHFLGRLSKEQMIECYKKNVVVFPSYIETVGLPLVEAKVLGCDIIAADCEYSREALGMYDKVQFFPPFNENRLTELIMGFVTSSTGNKED